MKVSKVMPALIILLIIICLILIPFRTALVFYHGTSNNIAAFLPLKAGEYFQIIFKHSIHLTDVVEKYHVSADLEIVQDEIIFEEFGIGMPPNAEGEAKFEYIDGKYHISELNQVFESINIRNGKTVSEHRLVWETDESEKVVQFNDYFEPGAWFKVKAEKLSILQYLKGVKINE